MSATVSGDIIVITLPDGKQFSFPKGVKAAEVVRSIGPKLARDAVAVLADSEILDLGRSLDAPCALRVLTDKDPRALEVLRHSTAHLTAHAVRELWCFVILSHDRRRIVHVNVTDGPSAEWTAQQVVEVRGASHRDDSTRVHEPSDRSRRESPSTADEVRPLLQRDAAALVAGGQLPEPA